LATISLIEHGLEARVLNVKVMEPGSYWKGSQSEEKKLINRINENKHLEILNRAPYILCFVQRMKINFSTRDMNIFKDWPLNIVKACTTSNKNNIMIIHKAIEININKELSSS